MNLRRQFIRSTCCLLLLTGLILLVPCSGYAEQVVIDANGQFDFAHSLMDKGDYSRAISEFERFIYFFPTDRRVPQARQLIGLCYLDDGKFGEARKVFATSYRADPESPLAKRSLFLTGESYYREGVYDKAEGFFSEVLKRDPTFSLRNEAFYRLAWTRMQENRWREASEDFKRVEPGSLFYEKADRLSMESLKGEDLPYKDPTTAGFMAAVLPGLGHAYVSRYKDAVIAFLLNGVFIWATIESFNRDNNVLGGILAFFEVGWYSGNIYSAVNVTHKWNRKVRNDFRKGLFDSVDLRLISSENRPAGVMVSFRF
jgi:outer membrane protein assembly factor BamD (BamD/ComL family)